MPNTLRNGKYLLFKCPSLLRDSNNCIKKFNWQAILSEFPLKLPTLLLLLKKILPKSDDKFFIFCYFTDHKETMQAHVFAAMSYIYFVVWQWYK